MMRCIALTLKNKRCLNSVVSGQYCRCHKVQKVKSMKNYIRIKASKHRIRFVFPQSFQDELEEIKTEKLFEHYDYWFGTGWIGWIKSEYEIDYMTTERLVIKNDGILSPGRGKVCEWENASKRLQKKSRHGGDEDLVGIIPEEWVSSKIFQTPIFDCCDVSVHKYKHEKSGFKVIIGAHG